MRFKLLAASALVLAPVSFAHADTYFNSIGVATANSGQDGLPDGTMMMADSFTAGSLGFTSITLQLSAATPGDGGSTLVYLVPDSGTASADGVASLPTYSTNVNGSFNSFAGAQLVGTVLDSSLVNSSVGTSLVSFTFQSEITTQDDEYWIALVPNTGSSLNWSYEASGSGVGLTGQINLASYSTSGSYYIASDPDINGATGPYGLIVDTPEPMSIAILGAALTGLGVVRRRGKRGIAQS